MPYLTLLDRDRRVSSLVAKAGDKVRQANESNHQLHHQRQNLHFAQTT